MTNGEIIEQLENAIELIKQDGKDLLDDRDIPILEVCIESLTVLDKIRVEIIQMPTISFNANDIYKADVLAIIDKYKEISQTVAEGSE